MAGWAGNGNERPFGWQRVKGTRAGRGGKAKSTSQPWPSDTPRDPSPSAFTSASVASTDHFMGIPRKDRKTQNGKRRTEKGADRDELAVDPLSSFLLDCLSWEKPLDVRRTILFLFLFVF